MKTVTNNGKETKKTFEWIPVSKKLPEEGKKVLVTYLAYPDYKTPSIDYDPFAYHKDGCWYWSYEDEDDDEVVKVPIVAWMDIQPYPYINKLIPRKLTTDELIKFSQELPIGFRNSIVASLIADKMLELKESSVIISNLSNLNDYLEVYRTGNWYLYNSLEELINDEWAQGAWEPDKTIGDVAKYCYDQLNISVFVLRNDVILQYLK